MKYYRKNTIFFRRGNGRRGSVIVLVVAVLALLAVIGTVYIVSARTERGSAAATAVAENLDLAQQAVNDRLIRITGDSIYDANGRLGGYGSTMGPFGGLAARRHDMPEANGTMAGVAAYDSSSRDQSWLVSSTYRMFPFAADATYNDMTLPVGRTLVKDTALPAQFLSPSTFDPSNSGALGDFALPLYTFTNGIPALNTAIFNEAAGNGFFRVVDDRLQFAFPDGSAGQGLADAFVQLLPFSEANGTRYRFGIRIIDTSRMANLNTGMPFNMASPNAFQNAGTYYNSYSLAAPTLFNSAGTFTTADVVGALWGTPGVNNPGRIGQWNPTGVPATYIDYHWGRAMFGIENPAASNSTTNSALVLPFDLTDELELRSLGSKGTMAVARPALGYSGGTPVWPNTLGNRDPSSTTVQTGPRRNFYTAFSYSRDLRPYADPIDGSTGASLAFEVAPTLVGWAVAPITNSKVWPPFPGCVAVNPDISAYTGITNPQVFTDALAIAATNIGTAMQLCGPGGTLYSADETRAFAANYLTWRWNSWVQKVAGSDVCYTLADGPSFMDETGFCIRTGVAIAGNGEYTSTLNSGTANKVIVGYAAQPFINEVAVSYIYDTVGMTWSEDDCAIELYNPYDMPLSLDDFKLNVKGTDIDFTGKNLLIPARGYFVLTKRAGGLDSAPTPIPTTPNVKFTDATTAGGSLSIQDAENVFLLRKYRSRTSNVMDKWATVDQYKVTTIATPPSGAGTTEIDFVARANKNDGTPANVTRWVATIHDTAVAEVKHQQGVAAPDMVTLGLENASDNAQTAIVPLYDRTLDLYATLGYDPNYQRLVPANIGDFARIARIANEIDAADATVPGAPAGNGAVSSQLLQKVTSPDGAVASTVYPGDAGVHFDFRTSPRNFVPGAPSPVYKDGDARAIRLLQCLAFTDRLSDLTIDLGDNTTAKTVPTAGGPVLLPDRGLSKLRIPGQINVNTASPEVLASIPVLQQNPKLIGYILAYRWRTNTKDVRIPTAMYSNTGTPVNCQIDPPIDFSNPLEFPGYGIHMLSELQIPIMMAQLNAGLTPLTIDQRDQLWAQMYNTLTVRSDTFVAYAYLEAVRQNPRYTGTFNNGSDWYATLPVAGIGVTDDPNNSSSALLRTARRRWVAVIDRSQMNYSRYLEGTVPPNSQLDARYTGARIVVQKDMPR